MKLPSTTLFPGAPVVPASSKSIPAPALPEIRLPAPAAVPPIVFNDESSTATPAFPLGAAAVPAALVPMRFPCTRLFVDPCPMMSMPLPPLPEMTLSAPGLVPPIVFWGDATIDTPSPPLPAIWVPVASTPM